MSLSAKSEPEQLITDNLDIWTAAIKSKATTGRGSNKKQELYGIKKLRGLIMELAVRGLLVPQDSNDEPASVLVAKIAFEKEQLIKDGKLKKQKKSKPFDISDEEPSLPVGWCMSDFGDITFNRDAERIPLSVSERRGRSGAYDYYGASGVIDSIDDFLFDKPLLLIGEDGANLVNRSTPIAFMAYGKYWVNNHAHVIDAISEIFLKYLALYINSISLLPYITGMAQPKMNQAKMNSIPVLVPPEQEIPRVLAKVDELMALCDQLEQQTESSLNAHKTLVETLLKALLDAAQSRDDRSSKDGVIKESAFEQAWQRIADHFDVLFTTEHSIDQLKQTILQLAVMGKLVPQDPNDEPVSFLIDRIKKHEQERVAAKEIQRPKKVSFPEPLGVTVPESWETILLNDIAFVTKLAGFEYTKYIKLQDSGEVPVIRAQNVRPFEPDLSNLKYIDIDTSLSLPRSALDRPALLVTFIGAGIGDVCVLDEGIRWHLAPNVAKVEPYSNLNLRYLNIFLSSPEGKKELFKSMKSTAQPSLSMTTIREIWFPIPPVEEQYRIVDKVEMLMDVCDRLKVRIRESQSYQLHLADAMAEQALN